MVLEKVLRQRSKEGLKLSSTALLKSQIDPGMCQGAPKHLFQLLYYSRRAKEEKDDEMSIKWRGSQDKGLQRDGGKKRKKDGRNRDKKEMEREKEGVQKPSERKQLESQGKLNLPAQENRMKNRERIFTQIGQCHL